MATPTLTHQTGDELEMFDPVGRAHEHRVQHRVGLGCVRDDRHLDL